MVVSGQWLAVSNKNCCYPGNLLVLVPRTEHPFPNCSKPANCRQLYTYGKTDVLACNSPQAEIVTNQLDFSEKEFIAGVDCSPSLEFGTGYKAGNGYQIEKKLENPEECRALCHTDNSEWCTVWVYNKNQKICYNKSDHGGKYDHEDRISGLKIDDCFVGNRK